MKKLKYNKLNIKEKRKIQSWRGRSGVVNAFILDLKCCIRTEDEVGSVEHVKALSSLLLTIPRPCLIVVLSVACFLCFVLSSSYVWLK